MQLDNAVGQLFVWDDYEYVSIIQNSWILIPPWIWIRPNNGYLELYLMNCEYVNNTINFRVWFQGGAGNFSLHHCIQNGSGAHPASYPMGTRGSFHGVKRPVREADHSPPSSAKVKEWVELYLHSPSTPSWHGAQLKGAQGQLYLYLINCTVIKSTLLIVFQCNQSLQMNSQCTNAI
jgi:hypothetical protein